jgi:hypothetical protein
MKLSCICTLSLVCTFAVAAVGAEDRSTRVSALEGNVTFYIPDGWEITEDAGKTLLGPKGATFVDLAYIEASPGNTSTEVDDAFLKLFVEKNLKVDEGEKLSGGRFIAHATSPLEADRESHQWNVASRIDARHLAVVIAGAETSRAQQKLLPIVDKVLRSVDFTPHK